LSFYFLTFCFVFTVSLPEVGRGYVLLPLVFSEITYKKVIDGFYWNFGVSKMSAREQLIYLWKCRPCLILHGCSVLSDRDMFRVFMFFHVFFVLLTVCVVVFLSVTFY